MAKQSTFFMGHFEITDSFRIKEKLKEQDWYREEPDKIINHLKDILCVLLMQKQNILL